MLQGRGSIGSGEDLGEGKNKKIKQEEKKAQKVKEETEEAEEQDRREGSWRDKQI